MAVETDLFGEPVRRDPDYQTARSGPGERMFEFPVTMPGQMALGAVETREKGMCDGRS
jgi:hypothetical protein